MWMVAPDAQPGGDPPSAYADLGRWLARAIAPGKSRLRAVEATGREIGRDLAPAGRRGSAEERMHGHARRARFSARARGRSRRERSTYTLCNCPYRDAVRENQPVVCTLHRGMTRGLLDAIAPETRARRLRPARPRRRRLPDRAARRAGRRSGRAGLSGGGVRQVVTMPPPASMAARAGTRAARATRAGRARTCAR